jgi:hypothetical protein
MVGGLSLAVGRAVAIGLAVGLAVAVGLLAESGDPGDGADTTPLSVEGAVGVAAELHAASVSRHAASSALRERGMNDLGTRARGRLAWFHT